MTKEERDEVCGLIWKMYIYGHGEGVAEARGNWLICDAEREKAKKNVFRLAQLGFNLNSSDAIGDAATSVIDR